MEGRPLSRDDLESSTTPLKSSRVINKNIEGIKLMRKSSSKRVKKHRDSSTLSTSRITTHSKRMKSSRSSNILRKRGTKSKSILETSDDGRKTDEVKRLRKRNVELEKALRHAERKLKRRTNAEKKIDNIVEEMKMMRQAFDKSEKIRKDQKELIKQMKGELARYRGDTTPPAEKPKKKKKTRRLA